MLNKEIYAKDPLANKLANNGVAEVKDDTSEQALETLRYELETFVCDGEYEKACTSMQKLIDELEVDDTEIVSRILERAKTSGRTDDGDVEIIKNRLSVYKGETAPVFAHYDEDGRSYAINGVGQIEEIFERLCDLIDSLKK